MIRWNPSQMSHKICLMQWKRMVFIIQALFWVNNGSASIMWNRQTEFLHVKEGLQPSIKAMIRDLFPEFPQLSFAYCWWCYPSPSSQGLEEFTGKLFGFIHSWLRQPNPGFLIRLWSWFGSKQVYHRANRERMVSHYLCIGRREIWGVSHRQTVHRTVFRPRTSLHFLRSWWS